MLSSSAIVTANPGLSRNLIVEGRIATEVPLHAHGVAVTTSGRVRGDIYGVTIRVEGQVIGDLFARAEVRVCSGGSVRGRITAPNVIVEDGADFKGQIAMQDSLAAPAPAVGATAPAILGA